MGPLAPLAHSGGHSIQLTLCSLSADTTTCGSAVGTSKYTRALALCAVNAYAGWSPLDRHAVHPTEGYTRTRLKPLHLLRAIMWQRYITHGMYHIYCPYSSCDTPSRVCELTNGGREAHTYDQSLRERSSCAITIANVAYMLCTVRSMTASTSHRLTCCVKALYVSTPWGIFPGSSST